MAKHRVDTLARYAIPLKVWMQRFAVLAFAAAALALILLGKTEIGVVEDARVALTDAVTPIIDALSRPAETVSDTVDAVRELAVIREENARLREENARLLDWERTARALEAQNLALRALADFAEPLGARSISARVIADPGGAYVRSVLLAVGAAQGVAKGQAVMTAEGLVGRVTEVGRRAARVLLITDINSRIPVRLERTRDAAILSGDNSDRPRLRYLPNGVIVNPGDRVVTSGDAGAFPPGLAIGEVAAVSEGMIRVRPFVDWNRLAYVRVVSYDLPLVIEQFVTADGQVIADQIGAAPTPLGARIVVRPAQEIAAEAAGSEGAEGAEGDSGESAQ